MGHSVWYLENRDMCQFIPKYIVKIEKQPALVESITEVDFDVSAGPSILNGQEKLTALEESVFAFSALPDIRSKEMHKESFVFNLENKMYHVLFIQEEDPSKVRGCTQKSIAIQCCRYLPVLPLIMSQKLCSSKMYTPEIALEALKTLELPSNKEALRILHEHIPPHVHALLEKHKNTIIENLMRCKSFLVIGPTPTAVSLTVSYLSMFCGTRYGGKVLPYRSSFVNSPLPPSSILGVTNEHFYKQARFDNIINTTEGGYYYKEKKCTEDLERLFGEMEEFFLDSPESFHVERWLCRMSDFGASIRARRIFREFFNSANFVEWLSSHGYQEVLGGNKEKPLSQMDLN
ncbi:hypothetical protein NEAUS04_1734 [Nematocida ausubeli]|nr:hypothetical protein NEAUS04_1734 [Nematocida ausubeli]